MIAEYQNPKDSVFQDDRRPSTPAMIARLRCELRAFNWVFSQTNLANLANYRATTNSANLADDLEWQSYFGKPYLSEVWGDSPTPERRQPEFKAS
ncbi:hypothetical protein CFAM422_004346 [Trichoderma lentiforme]|uniref:Uncharacterized protein n=1 Tax=Trichoderma lentiforme TaxID=1567552 RepID=A0A9P5CD61_9HYPO|nr:hypothetical protein CFAM422_004346 [Trichoderma lentiforme]